MSKATTAGDDLFGDSEEEGDTDDLLEAAAQSEPKIAKRKNLKKTSRLSKKSDVVRAKNIPDADNDKDDEELFDSENDDDDDGGGDKKKAAKSVGGGGGGEMSKRERMEALMAKKRQQMSGGSGGGGGGDEEESSRKKKKGGGKKKEGGYDSGDSYDSAAYERTQADDDFIDTEGEDPESVREFYSEQHFEDERPDGEDSEEEGRRRKGGGASSRPSKASSAKRGPDALDASELNDADNPLMAAVNRMKRKKKQAASQDDSTEEAKDFVAQMEAAADEDEALLKARQPATRKLALLPQVTLVLTKRSLWKFLLDNHVLSAIRRWIQPLPNGQLGNVTVRQRLLELTATMTLDESVEKDDLKDFLKESAIGKCIMALYMHPSETTALKRQCKVLIEQWSRPIFQKTDNMKDLGRVQRGDGGLAGYHARQQQQQQQAARGGGAHAQQQQRKGGGADDLTSMIAQGKHSRTSTLGAASGSGSRVRVPYSRGLQFSVRPESRVSQADQKKKKGGGGGGGGGSGQAPESRQALHKRMLEKRGGGGGGSGKPKSGLSVEGRSAK